MDLSAFSSLEEYRQRALRDDMTFMSGREGQSDTIAFVAATILQAIKPADGVLLDIGCGDGTLIKAALDRSPNLRCVGILPTREEVERLRAAIGSIAEIRAGTVHETGLSSGSVDYVVCNGVLQLAPPLENSLREIRRVAKLRAPIFIGELPRENERRPRSRLIYLREIAANLKRHGIMAAAGVVAYLGRAAIAGRWTEMTGKPHCWIEPDRFVKLASECGLEVVEQTPVRLPGTSGQLTTFPSRLNYVLRRGA